jgi:HK97 family phage major capsid protein
MLTAEQIRQKFGARPQKAVAQQARKDARLICEGINHAAKAGGRELTEDENATYALNIATMEHANRILENDRQFETFSGPRSSTDPTDAETLAGLFPSPGRAAGGVVRPSRHGLKGEALEAMASIASWMTGGGLDYRAADTPLHIQQAPISTGLADAIQVTIVDALRSYYLVNSFQLAGATEYNTGDTTPLIKPVISSGPDAEIFLEGQSSTDSHPMAVDSFRFGGVKYSRLVKASMESILNSALDLPAEIVSELAAGVANSFTKQITADCLAALQGNPATFVDNGSDPYGALSGLISAVPPRFADPSNAFMGSRAAKLRVNTGKPLFDQELNLTLGYRWVNNDNLANSRVIFGDWGSGAFVRRTGFFLQKLIELFSSTGEIGFRATQFLDSKFLASVHSVAVQPLYFTSLETEGS